MKKLLHLLFLLPIVLLASCSNDDDLAKVDLTLTLSGVTQTEANGAFYVVSGDNITIEGVSVKPVGGTKEAAIANVMYYFGGVPLIGNPANPFLGTFSTEGLVPGTYSLSLTADVFQVDKSITQVATNYTVVIVDSVEDLPEGAPTIGTYSATYTLDASK